VKNEKRKQAKTKSFSSACFYEVKKTETCARKKEEGKPDKRAGTVLKTVGALTGLGA